MDLAGLGFFGAIGLLVVPPAHHGWIYLAGVLYTLAQIGAWIAASMSDFALGIADKTVQIILIVLLVVLFHRERSQAAAAEASTTDAPSVDAVDEHA